MPLKIVIFLFVFISSSLSMENCRSTFQNQFFACNEGRNLFFHNNKKKNEKCYRDNEVWRCCVKDYCQEASEKRKLYFELYYALNIVDKYQEDSLRNCPPPEDEDVKLKSNRNVRFFELTQFINEQIKNLEVRAEYHKFHLNNLESFIQTYTEVYESAYENDFEKSHDYNKYQKPGSYLSDLYSYRHELNVAKGMFDFLESDVKTQDLNYSLNLKENKRIKKIFDEFKEITGFPHNIDDLRAGIDKKILAVDKEIESTKDWMLEYAVKKRIELDKHLPPEITTLKTIEGFERKTLFPLQRELDQIVLNGTKEDLESHLNKIELKTMEIERRLSLTSIGKRDSNDIKVFLKKVKRYRDNARKNLVYARIEIQKREKQRRSKELEESKLEGLEVDKKLIDDVDGEVPQTETRTIRVSNYDDGSYSNQSYTLTKDQWSYLDSKGKVSGFLVSSLGTHILYEGKDGSLKAQHIGVLRGIGAIIDEMFTFENFERNYPVENLSSLIKKLEEDKDEITRSSEGLSFYEKAKELNNKKDEVEKERNEKEEKIKDELARLDKLKEPKEIEFGKEDKPDVNEDEVVQDVVANILYYGTDFIPVVGNIKNLADLIIQLDKGVNILGEETDAVDNWIAGLAVLFPHIKTLKGGRTLLQNLINYIKKFGKGGINQIKALIKSGKLQSVLQQASDLLEKGINLFDDLPSNLWEYGKVVVASAEKLGKTAKEAIEGFVDDLSYILKNDFGDLNVGLTIKDISEIAGKATKPVGNMDEFFTTKFGKTIQNFGSKTSKRVKGESVYKITSNAPEGNKLLRKGDQIYLDSLHKDHMEVFTKNGRFKHVLNLDGTYNVEKTAKAMREGRRI